MGMVLIVPSGLRIAPLVVGHGKWYKIKTMKEHASRVSCLAWNNHILTSGGRDANIFIHDVRMENPLVLTLQNGHAGEVCSLQFNHQGTAMACGGSDNLVCLWDVRKDTPRLHLRRHTGSVKALAWSPYDRHTLVTGGGQQDPTIKIWGTERWNVPFKLLRKFVPYSLIVMEKRNY
jgi:WD40 repeat protein